jgi:hypothetical protein
MTKPARTKQQLPEFLTTAKRDIKGNVVKLVPYRMHCIGREEYYEVPKGSGRWQFYNGNPVSEAKREELVRTHPLLETPRTMDQLIEEKRVELARIEAEIEAKNPSKSGLKNSAQTPEEAREELKEKQSFTQQVLEKFK